MAELAELEQKLSALGPKVTDVRALLERVLGSDRSLGRLEQLLAELASGAPPARPAGFWPKTDPPPALRAAQPAPAAPAEPPAQEPEADAIEAAPAPAIAAAALPAAVIAAAIAHDTMVDQAAARTESAATSEVPAPLEAVGLLAGDAVEAEDEPELSLGQPSESPSAAASEPPPVELPPVMLPPAPAAETGPGVFAALFDLSEPPPPRVSYPSASVPDADTGLSAVLPEPPAPEPSALDAAERRARMDALLDQDLDPKDFPSTPPPRPAAAAAPDADVEEADEGDFELLVEDEEILEIEDAELEIVDDE